MSDDLVKRLRRVSMNLGIPSTTTLDSTVIAQAADRIEELEAKVFRLEIANEALEHLRPVWGQGYTNDSMAAQATASALSQLWKMLDARDQTHACYSIVQQQARIEELEAKLAKAVEALALVIDACDKGRMIPRPGCDAGGMTIEANINGSIYTGVPAWPIEEARTTLAELTGGSDE